MSSEAARIAAGVADARLWGSSRGAVGWVGGAPWRLWKGVGKALGEMSEKMCPQVASWDNFWTVLGLFFTSIFLLILVSVLDVLDLFNMVFFALRSLLFWKRCSVEVCHPNTLRKKIVPEKRFQRSSKSGGFSPHSCV